jgi:hypothetical protein
MRWVGHVAGIGDIRNKYSIFVENLKGINHFEDLGIDGKRVLRL